MNNIFNDFSKYRFNTLEFNKNELDLLKSIIEFCIVIVDNTRLFLQNSENEKFILNNKIKFKFTLNNLDNYLSIQVNEKEQIIKLKDKIEEMLNYINKSNSKNKDLSKMINKFSKIYLLIKLKKSYNKKAVTGTGINNDTKTFIEKSEINLNSFISNHNDDLENLKILFIKSNRLFIKSKDKNDSLFLLLYLYLESKDIIEKFSNFFNKLSKNKPKKYSDSSIQKIFNEVLN